MDDIKTIRELIKNSHAGITDIRTRLDALEGILPPGEYAGIARQLEESSRCISRAMSKCLVAEGKLRRQAAKPVVDEAVEMYE